MPPKLQLAIGIICAISALYCGIRGIREQFRSGESFLYLENSRGETEATRIHRKSHPAGFWYGVILWSVVSLMVLAYGVALIVEALKKFG
jgi:hypothetical protein